MTTEGDTKKQVLQDTKPAEHGEGHHDHHHGINANVPAPEAGNAANEAKARDETGKSGSLIAGKQTGDDPRGAGESGVGVNSGDPIVEVPEQPPMPVGENLHEKSYKTTKD
jgi:hypothetical protein